MIPLFKVFMAQNVEDFVLPILHSGYIGEGDQVQLFEKGISELIQNSNVVAVNSGTSAIVMALRLSGVGHGDYVMTTPVTCLATNEPILSFGAIPVWVDVNRDGTMNPEDLKCKIDSMVVKPKAIMCMDWGGLPCLLSELKSISKAYSIPLIQDACHSLGSSYCDKPIGNHADFVVFSFQAIKYVTTADGGALVVNNGMLKEAQLMRWFGLDRTKTADMRCTQDPVTWGYKFHMNDVAASIGLANICHLPKLISLTKRHAKAYNDSLFDLDKVWVLQTNFYRKSNYWLYTIFADDVKDFITYMQLNGVMCSQVHDRNDTKQMFKRKEYLPDINYALPGVDYFDKHHVCIPVGWWLSDYDVEKIIDLIKRY